MIHKFYRHNGKLSDRIKKKGTKMNGEGVGKKVERWNERQPAAKPPRQCETEDKWGEV